MIDEKNITLVMLESAMMHLQAANRRLTIITICALVVMAMMFGFFIYLFNSFEITTEDIVVDSGNNGNANYIGNDGDIVNGSGTCEEDYNKKEEQ